MIEFQHYVNDEVLKLDSVVYKNELGQNYTVTNFKYYISTIQLKKTDGKEISLPGYFLIREDEEESKKIVLHNIPVGDYTGLSFIIGVDSLHNCSGAQSGALDPANAMFWAWNTGYIFMKLEGKSPVSQSPGKLFEFHIGGYKQPNNCIRSVKLDLITKKQVLSNATAQLLIKTDVSEILKTPLSIDLSKLSSVTGFHNAGSIADNYSDMFSLPEH